MLTHTIILPSGATMPVVGLGTWSMVDAKELKEVMNAAFENGYRLFDTGTAFKNEHIIGEVIEGWISANKVKREDLFIISGLPFSGVHPDRVEMFLNKSLEDLRTNYVDMYIIHFPVCVKYDESSDYPVNELGEVETEPTNHVAVWKKLEEQVSCGKTKGIGLSNFNQKQIARILEHATIKPTNLHVEVHLYFQNKALVKFCRDKDIPIVAYSPLGAPALNDFSVKKGWPAKEVPKVMNDPIVTLVAKKHSKTPAQVMLRFLVQRGFIVIPKTVNPSRLRENIRIFDFELDDKDMDVLESLDKGKRICDVIGLKGMEKHPEYPF